MRYKLQGYINANIEITHLKSQIEAIDEYSGVSGISYDGISGGNGAISDMTFNAAQLRIKKKDKIQKQIDAIQSDITEVDKFIDSLKDKEYTILDLYYRKGTNWDNVAEQLGISKRQCQRIRDKVIGG